MEKHEVKLEFEVHCEGSQGDVYRAWLGKHLLSERQWRWVPGETYLIEHAPLKIAEGEYDLRLERVEPGTGVFTINNIKVNNARVDNNRIIVE